MIGICTLPMVEKMQGNLDRPYKSFWQSIHDNIKLTLEALKNVEDEIELVKQSGEIAPAGCWVVRYLDKGHGDGRIRAKNPTSEKTKNTLYYPYYRLQSKEPIFTGRNNKPTKNKHLGKAGSIAYLEAVAAVGRRSKLEALERQKKVIEQGLRDLAGEYQGNPNPLHMYVTND